jgi:hypothetical protein
MRRRTYLALSTAFLAGCGTGPSPETTTSTTPTETTTTEETETTEATTTTETTETPETETTETETPETETPDPDAEAAIGRAGRRLVAASEAYARYGAGGQQSFLDVTAATTNFETDAIDSELDAARDALDEAAATATEEQQATVALLREAVTFLDEASTAQSELQSGYEDYTTAWDLVYFSQSAELRVEDVQRAYESARPHLSALESETTPESADVTEAYTRETYESKVAQVRAEVRTYELAATHFLPYEESLYDLDTATKRYDNNRWNAAAESFGALADTYAEIAADVDDFEAPEPLDEEFAPFGCDVDALARGCELLVESASARADDDRERSRELKDQAEAVFEECGTLGRVSALQRIY